MKNIILGEDGKYRWVYELPMLKNPVILMTVWRVLLISGLILAGFGLIMRKLVKTSNVSMISIKVY